jgi:hypothetical protein
VCPLCAAADQSGDLSFDNKGSCFASFVPSENGDSFYNPSSALPQSKRTGTAEFTTECDKQIKEVFTWSSLDHLTRSDKRNHLIMQRRCVCSLKQNFEKVKKGKFVTTTAAEEQNQPKLKRRKTGPRISTAKIAKNTVDPSSCSAMVLSALAKMLSLASSLVIPPSKPPPPPAAPMQLATVTPATPVQLVNVTPQNVSPKKAPVLSLMDPSRWTTFRLATLEDLQAYHLELVIERPMY